MKANIVNNVLGGLVQGSDMPVRVRLCGSDNKPANIAYDIERIEVVDGVAYLITNTTVPHILPTNHRE